jgi:hypothetical protein
MPGDLVALELASRRPAQRNDARSWLDQPPVRYRYPNGVIHGYLAFIDEAPVIYDLRSASPASSSDDVRRSHAVATAYLASQAVYENRWSDYAAAMGIAGVRWSADDGGPSSWSSRRRSRSQHRAIGGMAPEHDSSWWTASPRRPRKSGTRFI